MGLEQTKYWYNSKESEESIKIPLDDNIKLFLKKREIKNIRVMNKEVIRAKKVMILFSNHGLLMDAETLCNCWKYVTSLKKLGGIAQINLQMLNSFILSSDFYLLN